MQPPPSSSAPPTPLVSDLVLIGGGHAHVHVLKMVGMEPIKSTLRSHGVAVTLIARDIMTPYSGMLPGFVSGHYSYEQIHVDLGRLCSFAGVRLVHASAARIEYDDGGGGRVHCDDGRPPVRYDALGIDVGSSPSGLGGIHAAPASGDGGMKDAAAAAAEAMVTPVKPIASFAARYELVKDRLRASAASYSPGEPFVLLVVGGGAGGIELALSVQHSLQGLLDECGVDRESVKVVLATRGDGVLEGHTAKVRRIFQRILSERGIEVRYEAEGIGVEEWSGGGGDTNNVPVAGRKSTLLLSYSSRQQPPILFHECLWCTSAGAATWLAKATPFATTPDGFLKVNDTYECVDYPGVFAAGDCCHMVDNPRPKAGVFAVRAGPPLRENLVAFLTKNPPTSHKPQVEFLGLISTGDKYAVASRGCVALEGEYLWTLKDYIDRTWMEGYTDLPVMDNEQAVPPPPNLVAKGRDAVAAFSEAPMRCGGCGAKVGATTVTRVLDAVKRRRLAKARGPPSSAGDNECKNYGEPVPPTIDYDDAAVVLLPKEGGGAMIHSIDFFRSFISDPFVLGKIAAVHALSDCHAMGAEAQTALALAVVPFAAEESITESTLLSMLSGASDALSDDGCSLVGGHTCEGAELALGFSVSGHVRDENKLLRKRGGRIGDKLVLTKPIGTGALFAADMRVKCKGTFVQAALESMSCSNGPASKLAREFGAGIHACTDVTGFGLAGHLLEMLTANDADESLDRIGAVLYLNEIPFFEGGLEASSNGIYSSLQRENFRSRRAVVNHVEVATAAPVKYPLVFDPQTAGGLLFFVDPSICDDFLFQLRGKEGNVYESASVVGELVKYNHDDEGEEGVCVIGTEARTSGQRLTIKY